MDAVGFINQENTKGKNNCANLLKISPMLQRVSYIKP